ncbi:hypothetical protein CU633_15085 [Bacillus sp. V3-13]|uniref:hypothetical protein n=1 Tax=Bacillus sp. V3-13 TaxID=2053728 RepID=UPI000C775D93|nr:hypothetical protein [Bacillus sp. V3-13]PLR76670.1 hypothetical protein CU633_15085 [Bacillus sp. V3-13]
MAKKTKQYLTYAPKETVITIQNDDTFPNLKNIAGDSVESHKDLEVANAIIGGEEIRQQNENL